MFVEGVTRYIYSASDFTRGGQLYSFPSKCGPSSPSRHTLSSPHPTHTWYMKEIKGFHQVHKALPTQGHLFIGYSPPPAPPAPPARLAACTPGHGAAVPGSQAHQHLKLAILANVPGIIVDCRDKPAEVPGPRMPVFLRDKFVLLQSLIIGLCFFCEQEKSLPVTEAFKTNLSLTVLPQAPPCQCR